MGTVQILFTALFLVNGVLSEETGSSETASIENEVSLELSECYGAERFYGDSWINGMESSVVDTLGKQCYHPILNVRLASLLTKSDLDGAFGNVSGEVCPSWAQSKECLRRHLYNKCNSFGIQVAQESEGFNSRLVASELICGPTGDYDILQMFKDAAVQGGLGDCLAGNSETFFGCVGRHTDQDGYTVPSFKKFTQQLFDCGDQIMIVCADGNKEQELSLISLWNKFRKAVQVTYGSLWDRLTAPVSILDLLK
jgi:hypothetical protein